MEAAGSCEWFVIYQATRRHISEDSDPELYVWQFRAYYKRKPYMREFSFIQPVFALGLIVFLVFPDVAEISASRCTVF
jgi:hypothetical protein